MFADDTNLVLKGQNINSMIGMLNEDLKTLHDYFKANKLKLNAEKTKLVCFRKKNKEFNKSDHQVFLDGKKLTFDKEATFLGVCLDEHLCWDAH